MGPNLRNFLATTLAAVALSLTASLLITENRPAAPSHIFGDYQPGRLLPAAPGVGALPTFTDAGAWQNIYGSFGQFLASGGPGGNDFWSTYNAADPGQITSPPLAGTWTHINFGGGTTLVNSGLSLPTVYLSDFTSGGTTNIHEAHQALAGSTYTFTAAYYALLSGVGGVGIDVTDGTKLINFMFYTGGIAAGVGTVEIFSAATATTSYTALFGPQAWDTAQNGRIWMRIKDDGTTRHFAFSVDGQVFFDMFTDPHGTFLTETGGGIFTIPNSTGVGAAITLVSLSNTSP